MTGDSFVIENNDFLSLVVADSSPISVVVDDPDPVAVVIVQGPQGTTGATGATGPRGGALGVSEVLSAQLQNGVTTTFSLANTVDTTQAVQVFRNGLLEVPTVGFLATSSAITFTTAPLSSDIVTIVYQKVQ